ncbi:MAG TPA: hypothetical protein VE622_03720 [Nitrososphaeraceae archaeon]|nr:hypothetical protein [Nitrososphaeraceae archaeon]
MPVFQVCEFVDELHLLGVNCKIGNLISDISDARRAYFERWLSNLGGFIKIFNGNIDYIGIEEVVRIGPFFDVYCLIENQYITENDDNAHKLLDAYPYFNLRKGIICKLGWSGGVLAEILTKDKMLCNSFADNIIKEEMREISIKATNFACIIQTRTWEPAGLASIYEVVDRIGLNIRELLKQIHLGDDRGT